MVPVDILDDLYTYTCIYIERDRHFRGELFILSNAVDGQAKKKKKNVHFGENNDTLVRWINSQAPWNQPSGLD